MSSDQHMADSSNVGEEPIATTTPTAMQATSESTSELITADEIKQQVEDIGVKPDAGLQELPQQIPDETASNVDSTTASVHTEQDQQTYANLEPILVAMELGQEILQGHSDEQHQTTSEDGKSTVVQMEEQPSDSESSQINQSDGSSETASNVVAITQEQLASLFANSGGGAGGNVIVTSLPSDGSGFHGLSLATILQDVVSGIQQNGSNANGGTAILGDSTGASGSYYLVTQGGTIPIVMPSNLSGSGVAMNLVQASSTDTTTFVTVNPDALPEGVDAVMANAPTTESEASRSSHLSAVQASAVDSSGISESETITESVSNDHELASAAAAAENERTTLEEAVTSQVPVVTTGVKRRLSNGPRVCEQCNKAFKYPSDLKKHLQIHTDIKKFKCNECNRFFRRLHQLIVHQRIHSGEKPYICKHCGTAFRHDSTLTMHVRTRHEHKRPFKCEYCEHTFGRLSHLRKHVKKVCGPNKQEKQASTIFQCKFCDTVFPSKIELRKHTSTCEKKESKAKPNQVALHVCNICNKDFASPYNVRRHQLTHSDDRPFECEFCNKSFKEKSSLTKHVKRVHVGKGKEDPLDDDNPEGELMVSISNQEQQFEVVSMAHGESLLAETGQSSAGEGNENENEADTTTVDATTLAQVAASVMVEELLHGEDQTHDANTAVTTSVTPSAAQQDIFISEAEKSAMIVSDETEGCMPETSAEVTASEEQQLVAEECLPEESPGQEADSSDMSQAAGQVSDSQFGNEEQEAVGKQDDSSAVKSSLVEEEPGNEVEHRSEVEPMELDNGPGEEVVTSTEVSDGQVSM